MLEDYKDIFKYKIRHNYLLTKYIQQIEQYHLSSNVEIQKEKEARFIKIVNRAYKYSPFYKDLYDKLGVNMAGIRSIHDINKLPIIEKKQIRNETDNIRLGPKYLFIKGFTSGTSGSPLQVYRDYKSILIENAYLWNFRKMNGLDIGDPVVSLRGVLDKNEIKRLDKASNILYLSSYNINNKNISIYIDELLRFNPKAIWGYPSSLYALGIEAKKVNLRFNIPLTFTSSETLHDYQRSLIADTFQTKIFDWYGNAERTIGIEQCKCGIYHEAPLYSINEYHPSTIITTNLINLNFPLIRYKIEDSVEWNISQNCCCNIPGPIITKINGRNDDIVILKDGSSIGRLGVSFKGIENILYSQIIQENMDAINVNLVVDNNFSNKDKEQLQSNLVSRLGPDIIINFRFVNESDIIKTPSGKFKLVVNNLNSKYNL